MLIIIFIRFMYNILLIWNVIFLFKLNCFGNKLNKLSIEKIKANIIT